MPLFHERLQEAMKEKEIAQKDLVEKTGIVKGVISRYVSGKMIPGEEKIKLLAKALEVSEEWLTGTEIQQIDISLENMINVFSKMSTLGKTELIKRASEMIRLEEFRGFVVS